MGRITEPGPEQDGEERGSSPSSFPGTGKDGQPGGFADGGPADVLAPGAELAGLLAAATGNERAALRALGDQEVLGIVAAGGRMAAWAAWVQTAGLAEFARRRLGGLSGSRAAREAAEEAGWKTAETWTRMLDQLTHAATMTSRLPRTLDAMAHGQVSEYKARIIEAQTAELSDADMAKADVILAARQMPAAEAVIAWQNIERRALDLHAAGVAGTAGQLQVQATLDFLLGRAAPGQDAHSGAHAEAEGAYQDAHNGARGGGRGGWVVNPVLLVPWDPSLGGPARPSCPGSGCSTATTPWTCSGPPGTMPPPGGA